MRPILLALLALAVALAGCSGSNSTPSTTPSSSTPASSTPASSTPATSTPATSTPVSSTPATSTPATTPTTPGGLGPDSYTLTTVVPTMAAMGHAFNVTLHVAGSLQFSSDHIGAHFAATPQPAPDASKMQACAHQSGSLPGDFVVSCNVTSAGTYYLRGHARVTENNVTHEYWGPEATVQVVNATVSLSGFPPTFIAGTPFSFKLAISGDSGTASVINARYGGNQSATPSAAAYPSTCQPTSGSAPGNYTITCTISQQGTYYLRGFATFGDASTSQATFWSDEQRIVVAGLGIG